MTTKRELYNFIQEHKLGVLATVSSLNMPEAAVVGIAVTTDLELVFDTIGNSRKSQNLRLNPKIAFVIGWDDEITVQYEGEADEPKGSELERYKQVYFERWPDGPEREQWPGITYFRARPTWIRYSDFNQTPAQITEQTFEL
jgi:pyridoxine/pyridoxamine 5'-phosphate oxidase